MFLINWLFNDYQIWSSQAETKADYEKILLTLCGDQTGVWAVLRISMQNGHCDESVCNYILS